MKAAISTYTLTTFVWLLFWVVLMMCLGCSDDEQPVRTGDAAAHESLELKDALIVTKAWVRRMPATVNHSSAYMTLYNPLSVDLVLVSVSTTASEVAELHETYHEAGKVHMRRLESVTIAAKSSVEFTPGGKHIMLMGLRSFQQKKSHAVSTAAKSGNTQAIFTLYYKYGAEPASFAQAVNFDIK